MMHIVEQTPYSVATTAASHSGRPGRTRAPRSELATHGGHEPGLLLYLEQIGRIPLLSASDEIELARKIARGAAARRQLHDGTSSSRQREAATRAVAAGEEARRTLIEAHLRLVVAIARRYTRHGVPLADLIQEGNLGLFRAVDKFDHRSGFRFSTYAQWWIRLGITRTLHEHRHVTHVPIHLSDFASRIARTASTLEQRLRREPTTAELANSLDVPVEKVTQALAAVREAASLDREITDDGTTLADVLPDDTARSPEEVVHHATCRSLISLRVGAFMSDLPERERIVLERRFGLYGRRAETLASVGRHLGLSIERVRQIETRALEALRARARQDDLDGAYIA